MEELNEEFRVLSTSDENLQLKIFYGILADDLDNIPPPDNLYRENNYEIAKDPYPATILSMTADSVP